MHVSGALLTTGASILAISAVALVKVLAHYALASRFSASRLGASVAGKHILVTGGSKGLGKAVAKILAVAGADVTIVARGANALAMAKAEVEESVRDHSSNAARKVRVHVEAIDLSDRSAVAAGVARIYSATGRKVDWVHYHAKIACAGSASPGFIADQLGDEVEAMMQQNMLSSANVVRGFIQYAKDAADKKPAANTAPASAPRRSWKISGLSAAEQQELPTKFVFVGSLIAAATFIGYSSYSASKYAQRGFCESLRSEFRPLGIDVHLYLPANMDTPGFVQENITKPDITAKIEGQNATVTAEYAAKVMLSGIMNGRFLVTSEMLGELARVGANGGVPRPNPLTEALAAPLVFVIFAVWSALADYDVAQYFKKAPLSAVSKEEKNK
ncbi:3-dehydrosphinganine reductase [Entophlyctis sp. JEL0112]|nr:3-dehydrosphinganine reductase [Entophlyctis sp. JEL0112]